MHSVVSGVNNGMVYYANSQNTDSPFSGDQNTCLATIFSKNFQSLVNLSHQPICEIKQSVDLSIYMQKFTYISQDIDIRTQTQTFCFQSAKCNFYNQEILNRLFTCPKTFSRYYNSSIIQIFGQKLNKGFAGILLLMKDRD